MDRSRRIEAGAKPRAVVVGGGFIGLEMAENLVHRGFEVTIVELAGQVLPPADEEFARAVEAHLEKHGVKLALNDGVAAFEPAGGNALEVHTPSGKAHGADLVILSIGVRPQTVLAKRRGSKSAARRHPRRRSDAHQRSGHLRRGRRRRGQGFRHGRMAPGGAGRPGEQARPHRRRCYRGPRRPLQGHAGTAIVGLFGAAMAWTGVSEKTLKRLGDTDYEKIYIHPSSHAGYYPGAKLIAMKVLFRKSNGLVLGAQAFGEDNVDKRISALAMAIQMHATIYDLEEAELCYAPQFGSAKDPVNFAGMAAANALGGDMPLVHWDHAGQGFLLDVREALEVPALKVPGAVHIPLGAAARAPGRTAARQGDPCGLPLRPALLYRHAHPPAAWVQGEERLRRRALAGDALSSRLKRPSPGGGFTATKDPLTPAFSPRGEGSNRRASVPLESDSAVRSPDP